MRGMSDTTSVDFGYPWWLTSGHLFLFLVVLAVLVLGLRRRWPRLVMGVLTVVTLWAGTAAVLVHLFGVNRVPSLPTEAFLRSGAGRVLDLGAGTGRSSVMVLRERPNATLVATDLFGESFDLHFGAEGSPQERLLANLRAAGVDDRASIATADMRHLPFEGASFDALVSAYAMDHLGRAGAVEALAEAARVVKPGGDFLLILVGSDGWTTFLFGPLLAHGDLPGPDWWRSRATEAGFDVVEEGRRPATVYFLLRK
jgi:SAM-dependent methyltransferase